MSEHDDDLARWADDDLVRALRAPGSTAELAEQEHYVAAFREARGTSAPVRPLPRRAAGRLGAGGTAVVVTVALTSGVAAAYTGHLPDPVQQIAHSVIGAPAPDADGRHHAIATGPRGGPAATRSADPGATTSPAPTDGQTDGATTGSSSSPDGPTSPNTSPGPDHHHGKQQPSPSDEPSPSTSTSAPSSGGSPASAMSMSAPAHRVDLGGTMTFTGLVTDATGAPLPGHGVVLQERGRRHWRAVVETNADSTGVASAVTPAVTRSTRFRWHADRGVNSLPWFVGMVPTLTLSADV